MNASDIVSDFMLQTCRQDRRFNMRSVQGLFIRADVIQQQQQELNSPGCRIPVAMNTGSVADMYIEPVLPCVADTDTMYFHANQIIFPEGTVVSDVVSLPDEFQDKAEWLEVITGDREFGGYVYLKFVGYFEPLNNGQFIPRWLHEVRDIYLPNICMAMLESKMKIYGPAATSELFSHVDYFGGTVTRDTVQCIRCPKWPTQASAWPTRHRYHGWPDSKAIRCIVKDGCHVVSVAHRLCRADEFKGKHQWRLSFSRAEVVLLNSWTPVQQIVYHMLRIFIKKSDLSQLCKDRHGEKIISNYSTKTLMLWAVEAKRWKENPNLISVCRHLLHTLAMWIRKADCKQYFITQCNVFEWTKIGEEQEILALRFASVTNKTLTDWFTRNYIQQCVTRFSCQLRDPKTLDALFTDISTVSQLQKAVSTVAVHCTNELKYREFEMLDDVPSLLANCFNPQPRLPPSLRVETYDFLKAELPKLDKRVAECLDGVFALHLAFHIQRRDINIDEIVDVTLVKIVGQLDFIQWTSVDNTAAIISLALDLLRHDGSHRKSDTLALMQTELAKAYLYRVLNCEDAETPNSTVCNVYLAALHYSTGEFQTAFNHCSSVTRRRQDHSHCSSVVAEYQLLPPIDVEIDSAAGLVVFFNYVRTTVLERQRIQQSRPQQLAPVFTAEILACYLRIKCSVMTSAVSGSRTDAYDYECWRTWKQYESRLTRKSTRPQVTDLLLHKLLSQKRRNPTLFFISPSQHPASSSQFDTSELYRLLVILAVERLTAFREIQHREFGSSGLDVDIAVITDDFRTMYEFKCKKYDLCVLPCKRMCRRVRWAYTSPTIPVLPTFSPLLDDGIIKLRGLSHLITRSGHRFFRLRCFTVYHYWWTVSMVNICRRCSPTARFTHTRMLLDSIRSAHTMTSENTQYDKAVLKFLYRWIRMQMFY